MRDNFAEKIHVGFPIVGYTQFAYLLDETLSPLVGIRLVWFVMLMLGMVAIFLEQARLDMFVVQERGECVELLAQKLIDEVHSGIDDARAMGLHRIGHVSCANDVEMLVATLNLHKQLQVHVVRVARGEGVNIAHDLQHVDALESKKELLTIIKARYLSLIPHLVDNLIGQIVIHRPQLQQFIGQVTHLLVGFPIVRCNRRQIVERGCEIVLQLICKRQSKLVRCNEESEKERESVCSPRSI